MTERLSRYLSVWRHYLAAVGTGHVIIISQALVQLLLVPLYLSTVGKSAFGVLVLIISYSSICNIGVTALHGLLLRTMALSAGQGDTVSLGKHFAATRLFLLGYYAVAGLGLIGLAWGYEILHSGEVANGIRVEFLIFFAILNLLAQAALSAEYLFLSALRRQARGHAYYILAIALFAAMVFPWLYWGGGIEGVIAAQFLSTAAGLLFARAFRRARLSDVPVRWPLGECARNAGKFLGRQGRKYLRYGLVAALLQGDILLVGLLGGVNAAAEFTVIWKIAEMMILLLWRISDSLQPEIMRMEARSEFGAIRRTHMRGFPLVVAVTLAAGLFYAVAGSFIVELWVGQGVVSAPPYVYWLAGGGILWLGIARFSAVFPYALARLDGLVKIAVGELILRVALIFALFGTLGYAANLVAISAAHVFGVAWAYILFARRVTRAPTVK